MLLLFCIPVLAQEGKAPRPVPKPDCMTVATPDPVAESCTFGAYRFTREPSGMAPLKVFRMESGNYVATSLAAVFRDSAKALVSINKRIAKDRESRAKTGQDCVEAQEFTFELLTIRFESQKAIVMPIDPACGAQATFTLRELNEMLK